jgi:hypothetical protein
MVASAANGNVWAGRRDSRRPCAGSEFFALAFTPALNPKLLAIDLPLVENRRQQEFLA